MPSAASAVGSRPARRCDYRGSHRTATVIFLRPSVMHRVIIAQGRE
jgi:hypothetical protein